MGLLAALPSQRRGSAEKHLAAVDPVLRQVIAESTSLWDPEPTSNPVWGLLRMVMAQQVATERAIHIAENVASRYPQLLVSQTLPTCLDETVLRDLGLPMVRVRCCQQILASVAHLTDDTRGGPFSDEKLLSVSGIGPWTVAVFRIFIQREPDILPLNDVGLERAIRAQYGRRRNVVTLSKRWRPYRSVACWHLWRTLGNLQLG